MNTIKKALWLTCLSLSVAQAGGAGRAPAPANAFTVYDAGVKLLQQYYAGPRMGQVDDLAQKVRQQLTKYCAGLKGTCPPADGIRGLNLLLRSELGDEHAGAISQEDPLASLSILRLGETSAVPSFGLTVSLTQDNLFGVQYVQSGGAAEAAGIQPGDILVLTEEQMAAGRFPYWLQRPGQTGVPVTLTVRRSGKDRIVTMQSRPASPVDYATLRWKGQNAILTIPSMLTGTSRVVNDLVNTVCERKADTLVVDLRQSSGGLFREASAMAQTLGKLATPAVTVNRQGIQGFIGVNPEEPTDRSGCWNHLVGLIGHDTASASEDLAFWLKQGGVHLYGEDTRGLMGGSILPFIIPGPTMIQFTVVRVTTDGKTQVPDSVQPDVASDLSIQPEGVDPIGELLRAGSVK